MSLASRAHQFQSRSALALAEAIVPGSSRVPAADEVTVAAARDMVSHFEPVLGKAWTAAQSSLSAAAIRHTGRPFHWLSADAQDRLLRRWEADPVLRTPLGLVSLVYKMAHFDRRDVYEQMGGRRNEVARLENPRWLQQVHRADSWTEGETVECDVVVIGTGAGGAVVGKELAERGLAVVFVEEGEHYRRDAFDGSSVNAHQRFYRAAVTLGNAAVPVFMGRLVGGSTAINTGSCYRTPDWVLQRWCDEMRTEEFAPAAMERHFERVERIIGVAPTERRVIGPIADVMARGCDALGWHHGPILRNAPGCDGSGFCDFGCRTDARQGTNLSYVPKALDQGAVLLTGLRAEKVILEGGRAVGIEATSNGGRAMKVRAQAVVLAGGGIPSPLFLLGQGLGNGSGQVGRNLTIHPSAAESALFEEPIRGPAHAPQGYFSSQFMREGILIVAAQPDYNISGLVFGFSGRRLMDTLERIEQTASFGLLLADDTRGRVWRDVRGYPAISYSLTSRDVAQAHRALVLCGEMLLAAGATHIIPALAGGPILARGDEFDAFRNAHLTAADILWTSYHPLGTCKMGPDRDTSVVDLDHQVHEVPGLFVIDGSTVPGPLGVNPQITIMGMATRAAERLADRLGARHQPSVAAGMR